MEKNKNCCGEMVEIPAGKFWMGAQEKNQEGQNYDCDACPNESPVREVELSAYNIGKYPVTVEQYQRFIEEEGYKNKLYRDEENFDKFTKPDNWEDQKLYPSRPVVGVNWYEAAAYARWCDGRLPTEAEWERAARGPGQTYRKYPWGNNPAEDDIAELSAVGLFPERATAEGIHDMAGHIWQWCQDQYHATEGGRVVRGGSFSSYQDFLRCAARHRFNPLIGGYNLGFRVVRGPSL